MINNSHIFNNGIEVVAEFNFETGEAIMHKKTIEIGVDESGNPILDVSQQKHSKCPVCGKHGVKIASIETSMRPCDRSVYRDYKPPVEFHGNISVKFICENCAPRGGEITCDSKYIEVKTVKMKKISEYRFFARFHNNSEWQLILETTDKAEYELIRKYDFKLCRVLNQLNEYVKVEEKTEWVKV